MYKQLHRSAEFWQLELLLSYLRGTKVQSFNRHPDHNECTCLFGYMCITDASSPAGLILLSSGIDQLIDSSTRRTQKPIYHRQGFYSAAAALTGRKSIYSYQLIRQQVTTEMREHARYKPKLWFEKMETLMLMWDGIGGGWYTKKRSTQKDICHCTIMDQTDAPLYNIF